MPNRRVLVIGVVAILAGTFAAGRAHTAEPSAEALLKAIYTTYVGDPERALGIVLDDDAAIRRYFEPTLAALIIKDRAIAAQDDKPPALDGDPFVGAQDWAIEALEVAVQETGPDKATGTVKFKNFGAPVVIGLDLVRVDGAWKISDIRWPYGSLRAVLTEH